MRILCLMATILKTKLPWYAAAAFILKNCRVSKYISSDDTIKKGERDPFFYTVKSHVVLFERARSTDVYIYKKLLIIPSGVEHVLLNTLSEWDDQLFIANGNLITGLKLKFGVKTISTGFHADSWQRELCFLCVSLCNGSLLWDVVLSFCFWKVLISCVRDLSLKPI